MPYVLGAMLVLPQPHQDIATEELLSQHRRQIFPDQAVLEWQQLVGVGTTPLLKLFFPALASATSAPLKQQLPGFGPALKLILLTLLSLSAVTIHKC